MPDSFDPTAPLPSAPDPWADSEIPSHRAGPPYHMTDMISAEPHLARRLLGRLLQSGSPAADLAAAIAAASGAGHPIVFAGCGTSEHASIAAAEIVRDALQRTGATRPGNVLALEGFEASLQPLGRGVVIGVSHEGGTAATRATMAAARAGGARTAAITAGSASPAAKLADIVLATGEMDQSYCHTIGYVSPLLAVTAVAAHLTRAPIDAETVAGLLEAGIQEIAAEVIAGELGDASHLIIIASGADRPAARELAIKIEEASWLPTTMRDLETFLHGHVPATDESTGLVLIQADRDHRDERVTRARQALASAGVVGLRRAAILSEDAARAIPDQLTPAGRIVVREAPDLPSPIAALFASATPLQLITERVARARGTNPDPIRRDDARYREAASVSGT